MHDVTDPSYDIVARCSAKVIVPRHSSGSGFWVAPDKLVTCAHVVTRVSAEGVIILYAGRELAGKVDIITDVDFPDIAVIHVDGSGEHPWVRVAPATEELLLDDRLLSYGFSDAEQGGGSERLDFRGYAERMLKLGDGQVMAGHSGGPVVNLVTGSVVGVMKRTRDSAQALGGRAIPISCVPRQFTTAAPPCPSWDATFEGAARGPARWPEYRAALRQIVQTDAERATPLDFGFELGGRGFLEPFVVDEGRAVLERISCETFFASLVDGTILRSLVVGHGGSGKSMLLRRLAQRATAPPTDFIPFFLPASALVSSAARGVSAVLSAIEQSVERVQERLYEGAYGISEAHLRDRLRTGRVLLLIDGVDEVQDAGALGRLAETIRDFVDHEYGRRTVIVLASRDIARSPVALDRMQRFRVGHLEPSQVEGYLNEQLGSHTTWGLRSQIRGEYSELLSSPMHLAIFVRYVREEGTPGDLATLYRRVVSNQLSAWQRTPETNPPCNAYESIEVATTLRKLAFGLLDPRVRVGDRFHPTLSECVQLTSPHAHDHLMKAEQAGLLVRGADYVSFFHRTVQEALAGEYLASSPADVDPILEAFDAQPATLIDLWQTPLTFFAEYSSAGGKSKAATRAVMWLLDRSVKDGPLMIRLRLCGMLVATGAVAEDLSLLTVDNLLARIPTPSSSRAVRALEAALRMRGRSFAPGLKRLAQHDHPAWRHSAALLLTDLPAAVASDPRSAAVILQLLRDDVATNQAREAVWAQKAAAAIPFLKDVVRNSYTGARFIAAMNLVAHAGMHDVAEFLRGYFRSSNQITSHERLCLWTRFVVATEGLEAACERAASLEPYTLIDEIKAARRDDCAALLEKALRNLTGDLLRAAASSAATHASDQTRTWLIEHHDAEVAEATLSAIGRQRGMLSADALQRAFLSNSPAVRKAASEAASACEEEMRIHALRLGLQDPDPLVAREAVHSLSDADLLSLAPVIADCLATWSENHWKESARRLTRFGPEAIANVAVAVADCATELSAARLHAIMGAVDEYRDEDSAAYAKVAASEHPLLAAAALSVLGSLDRLDEDARLRAESLLQDKDDLVRMEALSAIAPALRPGDAAELARLADGRLGAVRAYAICLLTRLGVLHDLLFQNLADVDSEDRRACVTTLASFYVEGRDFIARDSQLVDIRARLVEIAWHRGWTARDRATALSALTRDADPGATALLQRFLDSESMELRYSAAVLLLTPGLLDLDSLGVLASFGDEHFRTDAVVAALSPEQKIATRDVIAAFRDDESVRVRANLAKHQPALDGDEFLLDWAMLDLEVRVRREVARRLSEIAAANETVALVVAVRLLEDEDSGIVVAAASCCAATHLHLVLARLDTISPSYRGDLERIAEHAMAAAEAVLS